MKTKDKPFAIISPVMVKSARLNVMYGFNDPEIAFRNNRTSESLKMFFSKFTTLFIIMFDLVAVSVAFFNCKVPSELPETGMIMRLA
jgi:hypothetical protein